LNQKGNITHSFYLFCKSVLVINGDEMGLKLFKKQFKKQTQCFSIHFMMPN